jgi:hypothetical protein
MSLGKKICRLGDIFWGTNIALSRLYFVKRYLEMFVSFRFVELPRNMIESRWAVVRFGLFILLAFSFSAVVVPWPTDANNQKALRKMILSYRLAEISHMDFYSYLKSACKKTGIKFESYAALSAYTRYVQMSDTLDHRKLFTELKELEERRYDGLIIKPKERVLVKQSMTMSALAKIVDMAAASDKLAWSKNSTQ